MLEFHVLHCVTLMKVKAKFGGKVPGRSSVHHPLHGFKAAQASLPKTPPGDSVEQKDIAAYLPPAAMIWKARHKGGWISKLPPHSEHLEKWAEHGGSAWLAGIAGVRHCWVKYLDDNGLPVDHCPIKGIFS